MKKIFASILAVAMSMSMFASITSNIRLTLVSESDYEAYVELKTGSDYSSFDPTKCSTYFDNLSNTKNIGMYAIYESANYSNLAAAQFVNVPLVVVTSREAAAKQNYWLYVDVLGGAAQNIEALTITDLRAEGGAKTVALTDALTDGLALEFSLDEETAYTEGTNSIIADRFVINYTYVIMKGDFTDPSWAYTSDFTHNGATASLDLTLDADTWYHFQIEENGAIGANGSAFDKDNKSYIVPATGWVEQLTLHTDAAGTYTFTWTYATDNLTITFPAPASAGYDVTLNAYGLATFSADANGDAEIPTGLKAYTATYVAMTEVLNLSQITSGKIPAGAGVILYGEPNAAVTLPYTTGAEAISGTNHLQPSASFAAADDIYVLSGNMMYQYTESDALPANKAFLKLPGGAPAPRRITLHFDEAQGVENVGVDAKAQKFIGEDGQIYLRRGNEVYNLQGQIVK